MKYAGRIRFDLLAQGPIRKVLLWPGFPVVFQAAVLVCLFLLVANGLGVGRGRPMDELMTLRKTNLTTLVVWGLWWPGMIAVTLLLGRAWCTVCPMELVHRIGDAVARRIGWPRARLGAVLRGGWFVLLGYLALQVLIAGIALHRVPHYTSWLLLCLIGLALAAGFLFREPRSFCTAFCPAAALLSVYSRFTPVRLDVRDESVCGSCSTRDCMKPDNLYRFDGRSCPSLIRPDRHRQSDGCVVCVQCAKACPHDNVGIGLMNKGAPSRRLRMLRPFEAVFVLIAAGFVSHEVINEVKWLDRIFHFVPEQLHAAFPFMTFRLHEAFWYLLLFPLLVWAVVAAIGYLSGHRAGLKKFLLAAATGAAPVVAVAHLSKAAAKIAGWGGYLPLAAADPNGESTFDRISTHLIDAPTRLADLSIVGMAMLVAILWITWLGWKWSRTAAADLLHAARTGLAFTAVLYAAVLVVWCLT